MCKEIWLILHVMHTFRVIIHPDRRISTQTCNVSNWNVDLFKPNTIDSYCRTRYITALSDCVCVIAPIRDDLTAHFSRLLCQFIRNHRNPAIESQSRSNWLGMRSRHRSLFSSVCCEGSPRFRACFRQQHIVT